MRTHAQSAYADSVMAIPCTTLVARAATQTPTVQDVWNAFRCRGDRDAVAVALWQHPLLDPSVLDTFRAAVPGSARVVALMFEAAQSEARTERRFTALGVLARFIEPSFVVSPGDRTRVSRDARGLLEYSPRMLDHPRPPEPVWGPAALERVTELARVAPDEEIRAASRGVVRLYTAGRTAR